ncbi:hypothetical protein TRAPUB_1844 [Trametes pubescens]|uniref:Secreted protein n=1 Tax=Trametes pubescens TaxID=154538 RepID=A0A1M2VI81_TRAPU|nr:hypothetical protein TRAPUB_1844 [Trametes pubescens]
MKTFATLLSVCAVVVGSCALFTPRGDAAEVCTGAKTVSSSTVNVGSKAVALTTFSCDAQHSFVHADDDPTPTSIAPAAPVPTTDVCGVISGPGSNVCGDSGTLPPVTEDCATIMDAITILNGSGIGRTAPTFGVAPGHAQTLTFGTCRFFFENDSPLPMSNCWLSFVRGFFIVTL